MDKLNFFHAAENCLLADFSQFRSLLAFFFSLLHVAGLFPGLVSIIGSFAHWISNVFAQSERESMSMWADIEWKKEERLTLRFCAKQSSTSARWMLTVHFFVAWIEPDSDDHRGVAVWLYPRFSMWLECSLELCSICNCEEKLSPV